jgi:hypothetical protein
MAGELRVFQTVDLEGNEFFIERAENTRIAERVELHFLARRAGRAPEIDQQRQFLDFGFLTSGMVIGAPFHTGFLRLSSRRGDREEAAGKHQFPTIRQVEHRSFLAFAQAVIPRPGATNPFVLREGAPCRSYP